MTYCDSFTRELLDVYPHYKNGTLPFKGGLYEQPAFYQEAMTLVDYCMSNK